jgi:hypothetical protein
MRRVTEPSSIIIYTEGYLNTTTTLIKSVPNQLRNLQFLSFL